MLTRENLLLPALIRVTPDANFTAHEPITGRFPFTVALLRDSVFVAAENSRETTLSSRSSIKRDDPFSHLQFRNVGKSVS